MDKIGREQFIGGGWAGEDEEFSPEPVDFEMSFRHAVEVSGKQMGMPVRSLGKRFELEIENWELPTRRSY